MSVRHATPAELEAYVLGTLDAASVESFEDHCAACDACAGALAGEAKLEIAFEQVARKTRAPGVLPARAAAYGVVGLVAMAAAVFLWMVPRTSVRGSGAGATVPAVAGQGPRDNSGTADGAILDARNDALDGG